MVESLIDIGITREVLEQPQLSVSVIIPTINEEEGISPTLSELSLTALKELGCSCEIIVVDGGSTDRTRERAELFGARIIHEPRKGYGRAYKTGFNAGTGDILVAFDGDHTYPAFVVSELIETMIREDWDFITTNRLAKLDPGAMTPIHKLGNWILSTAVRLLFSVMLKDSQSGMWVIKKSALERIMPSSNGMAFSQEIKIRAFRSCKSVEIPVQYRRRKGNPKIRTVLDGFRNLLHLIRLRFSLNSEVLVDR
jgi:glycosyltransferase involved in cell wall biosynthesis